MRTLNRNREVNPLFMMWLGIFGVVTSTGVNVDTYDLWGFGVFLISIAMIKFAFVLNKNS